MFPSDINASNETVGGVEFEVMNAVRIKIA